MDYVYLKIQVANFYHILHKYLARKIYCSDVKQVSNQLKDVVTRRPGLVVTLCFRAALEGAVT